MYIYFDVLQFMEIKANIAVLEIKPFSLAHLQIFARYSHDSCDSVSLELIDVVRRSKLLRKKRTNCISGLFDCRLSSFSTTCYNQMLKQYWFRVNNRFFEQSRQESQLTFFFYCAGARRLNRYADSSFLSQQ